MLDSMRCKRGNLWCLLSLIKAENIYSIAFNALRNEKITLPFKTWKKRSFQSLNCLFTLQCYQLE